MVPTDTARRALAQRLQEHHFNDHHIATVLRHVAVRHFRAGQEVPQTGPDGTVFSFIVEGCVCFYAMDAQGKKWTRYLGGPRDFIASLNAILPVQTRPETLECLTDCRLVTVSRKDYDLLCEQTSLQVQIQQVIIDVLVNIARERSELMQMNATERYDYFMRKYPTLNRYVKLGDVASYIGIRQQSLSRIRRQLRESEQ